MRSGVGIFDAVFDDSYVQADEQRARLRRFYAKFAPNKLLDSSVRAGLRIQPGFQNTAVARVPSLAQIDLDEIARAFSDAPDELNMRLRDVLCLAQCRLCGLRALCACYTGACGCVCTCMRLHWGCVAPA
jgi:hypothetical protein